MKGKANTYTVGSLFAGVGGICYAFRDANCRVLWANEIDKSSVSTYQLNHKGVPLVEPRGIEFLKAKNVEHVDILTAGFPCQPFSQAGRAHGFNDPRGRLFFHVTRLLKHIEPVAYLLENVKTIVQHDNGDTFQIVRSKIREAGYSFIPFVLNSARFVDIPQGRERIFIIGFKGEKHYSHSRPVKLNETNGFLPAKYSSRFRIPKELVGPRRSFREFLEPSSATDGDFYTSQSNIIHQRVRETVIDENTVYQYRRWFVRTNKSNVCPTLTANMGLGGHNVPIVLDGSPRRLTPKECFNLQGFPEDFKLPNDISKTQLYRQAGNSVVVPLVRLIAEEIVRVLDENRGS